MFSGFLTGVLPGALGAMGGAIARALVETGTDSYHQHLTRRGWWPSHWPLATFLVNIGGSFLLGVLTAVTLHWHYQYPHSLFVWLIVNVLVGFTGGFSTFSTALVDAVKPVIVQVQQAKLANQLNACSHDNQQDRTATTASSSLDIPNDDVVGRILPKNSSVPPNTTTLNRRFTLPTRMSFWHLFSALIHTFLMAGLCLLAALVGLHSIFFL